MTSLGNITPSAVTDDHLVRWMETLSNWGVWGHDDDLGTLNHITPAVIARAATSVTEGVRVACSRAISPRPVGEIASPALHFMVRSGESAPSDGADHALDWIGMTVHGFAVTHLDALGHVFWNGQMYNGRPAADVTTSHGARSGSIEVAAGGVVSRGILLDVARARGTHVVHGEPITPDELDEVALSQNVVLEPGDILFVRLGRDLLGDRYDPEGDGSPGLHAACLPWLHEHKVAVLATDVAADEMPSTFAKMPTPIHTVGIVAMGLHVLDNADLSTLATTCDAIERWHFLAVLGPLHIKHGTGSPVNPIAIF